MAQQPNIELEIFELPRPAPAPGPARSWRPGRPGDVTGPGEVPTGGLFGTPGPDAGFALTLVEAAEVPYAPGEDRAATQAALAAVMIARASAAGRAPTKGDLEAATTLLGLREVPEAQASAFAEYRRARFAGFEHDPEAVRVWLATLPGDLVHGDVASIRAAVAAGPEVLDR